MRIAIVPTTLAAALFMAFSTMATAQTRTPIDVSSLGPQVGDRVPDFSLPDQNGEAQTLGSLKGPNGIILLFHRSADW
jgi:cytochrome oxidase Cu insertion factor (SCO1/SenC/PrrC family)